MKVVVVGGGVIGLACAVRLAAVGHRVTVLDPDDARAAPSWNNAGHLAVEQVAPLASLATLRSMPRRWFAAGGPLDLPSAQWPVWVPFGIRLLAAARPSRFRHGQAVLTGLLGEAMPAWRRLAATTGEPDLVRARGHLVAWETAGTARRGRAAWEAADTGTATLADADAADRRLLSDLTGDAKTIADAARFAGSGQIGDLDRLAQVLEAAVVARGGTIVRQAAQPVLDRGRVQVVGHEADLVVVAAGVASGAMLRPFGHRVPIVAERGYHIRAAARDWPANAPPIVFEDRAMIVTRYADVVQAASFVELAAPGAPPDPRKWERLERHVRALGLPMAPPFTRWMGARPTLPDYLPAIGRSRRAGNLVYAFGHHHLGLTLAPVTAELVSALADGATPSIDLTPCDIDRFTRLRSWA